MILERAAVFLERNEKINYRFGLEGEPQKQNCQIVREMGKVQDQTFIFPVLVSFRRDNEHEVEEEKIYCSTTYGSYIVSSSHSRM